jgi:hypothetical protein
MNLFPSAVEKKEINDLLMRSNDIPTSALPEKAEINLSDEDDDFLIGERNVDIYIANWYITDGNVQFVEY